MTPFIILTILLLACTQTLQIPSIVPETDENESFNELALESFTRIAKGAFNNEPDGKFTKIVSTAYKCITKPKQFICYANNTELNQCMRPLQTIFDKTVGTNYEGYARKILNSIISGKDYLCNAKFKEIFGILKIMKNGL